eukprot:CAMPEP_0194273136 /NCGR_PEP_ID=MMETSP0169-20130528/6541_1 /TAXON_ID=218684 /ORGANISM="Corethron pennatum, Strain L29A3" /LENGTH=243 /DNA_ID=CAMNT_0039015997 /DNA_START=389 /DNA_END=1120 /DNA_ORIENTATION=+
MDIVDNPEGSAHNYIIEVLPEDILKRIFKKLPNAHRFAAPVCRKFRDLYVATVDEKKKNTTYKYCVSTEAALTLYLSEAKYRDSRRKEVSIIGAGAGRIDWVKRGGKLNLKECRAAARAGQLDVLKWLRNQGCQWSEATCNAAAAGGHLGVLQWAREKGCSFSNRTCTAAASGGHLKVLQWLRENDCSWNKHTCRAAVEEKHFHLLWWAINNGCPYDEKDFSDITDPEFFEWYSHTSPNEMGT